MTPPNNNHLTIKMIDKTLVSIFGIGVASSVALAATVPELYPVNVAAFGGALGGAAITSEARRKKAEQESEAVRVAVAFNGLYEINKGLVSPQQLSFMCGVPVDKTSVFLRELCKQQAGTHIPTNKGEIYSFPHPSSILEQLTSNSQAWVKSQVDPLLEENAVLKAELARIQMVARQRQPIPQAPASLKNTEETDDPWNKLL
ncbi:MAG: hypothetical protein EB101_04770 [Chitinophagia bacterium]|nr:hypothetical protein [Chitinophagia bacterium]